MLNFINLIIMAKKILKQIVGTVAQGVVLIGKGVIVIGSLLVPRGYDTVKRKLGRGTPHAIKDLEKWKNG